MSYEDIIRAIDEVPVTYLPGLLIHVVRSCVSRKVFVEGGLERVVKSAKESVS